MLKVCLVGAGNISGVHIPAWEEQEDTELVALCDVRQERLDLYPEKHHYTDFDEMIEKEQPDILDICLPTFLHAQYAKRALEKGIHVLCEKPISLAESDVKMLYDTAKQHGVRFMVAQVLRWWPEYELVKEIYDDRRYGALISGHMTRHSEIPGWTWDNWMRDKARSGFVPFDLHIHDLDFLVYAFGAPTKVEGHRHCTEAQDTVMATYCFGDAFVATDSAWFASPVPFEMSFRFQFENAVLCFNGETGLKIYERGGGVLSASDDGTGGDSGVLSLPKTNAYANEIRYFTDCVKAGRDCDKVQPEQLLAVLEILNRL